MDYTILPASSGDVMQIVALEQACFSLPHTGEQLQHELEDDVYDLLVAREGDRLLGYVGLSHVLEEGYITNIAVEEASRRKGVGDRLMKSLDAVAERLSLAFISLEVRESNNAAIALYEKNGYRRTGLIPGGYTQPKENAVVMTKSFTQKGKSLENIIF